MPPANIDAKARVVYIRDAMIFPSLDHQTMELHTALELAVANHKPGESPVIIGNQLQLIGIDAIRSARTTKSQKSL